MSVREHLAGRSESVQLACPEAIGHGCKDGRISSEIRASIPTPYSNEKMAMTNPSAAVLPSAW